MQTRWAGFSRSYDQIDARDIDALLKMIASIYFIIFNRPSAKNSLT